MDPLTPDCRDAPDTSDRTLSGTVAALRPLAVQYLKFGLVGGAATLTHSLVFIAVMEHAGLAPLAANLLAYGVAVFVSYFGNFRWTFGAAAPTAASFARFVAVTLVGLALNSAAVWLVMDVGELPYPYVLPFMIVVVPVVVFALNRAWSFRS